MNKKINKLIALILCLTVSLTCVPIITSSAVPPTSIVDETVTDDVSMDKSDESAEPTVLYESVEKRSDNTKHFRTSDGSYTAAVYPYDIHYINEKGEYEDKDNSLIDGTDDGEKIQGNKFTLKNIGSKVMYEYILKNTDIELSLVSTSLKENIILKKAVDFDSLVYNI